MQAKPVPKFTARVSSKAPRLVADRVEGVEIGPAAWRVVRSVSAPKVRESTSHAARERDGEMSIEVNLDAQDLERR